MTNKALIVPCVVLLVLMFSCTGPQGLGAPGEPAAKPAPSLTADRQEPAAQKQTTGAAKDGAAGEDKIGAAGKKPGKPRRKSIFSAEKEAEILTFVEEHFPEERERFSQLKEDSANGYRRALQSKQRLMRQISKFSPHLKQAHIARHRAHRAKWRALSALRGAKGAAETKKLMIQLRKAITEYFDANLSIDGDKIDRAEARLSARLKQLRGDLDERIRDRDKIIERRLQRELRRMTERAKLAKKPKPKAPATEPTAGSEGR